MRDFSAEVERARAELARDRFGAVERLRGLEEQWARALLGLSDGAKLTEHVRRWVERGPDVSIAAEAVAHLHEAEQWQWQIGTWATGAGEGLSSMAEVRKLQAAQAWLRAATGDVAAARALIAQVDGDPNGMGQSEAAHTRALLARLDSVART